MYLSYHTNGMAHHDLFEAVSLLAEIGYQGVAITIDHHVLSPRAGDLAASLARLRRLLGQYGMRSVIETGARFLLDPRQKHEPTLISPDPAARARRIEFYRHAIRCAAELESDCVSLWSGVQHSDVSPSAAYAWLAAGLGEVLGYAAKQGVVIAFEPEPGMLIDTTESFAHLLDRYDLESLRLTLDMGHLHCQGEPPVAVIHQGAQRLVNVHLEDMRQGVHEHLMFGEGEIDFPPILRTLGEVGYQGGVHVELSRHSHEAPTAARRAFDFLQPFLPRP